MVSPPFILPSGVSFWSALKRVASETTAIINLLSLPFCKKPCVSLPSALKIDPSQLFINHGRRLTSRVHHIRHAVPSYKKR